MCVGTPHLRRGVMSGFTAFSGIPPIFLRYFSSITPDTSTTARREVSVGSDRTFGKTIPHILLYVFRYRKPVFIRVDKLELILLSRSPPDASLLLVPISPQDES
jgi:hypothetical protein